MMIHVDHDIMMSATPAPGERLVRVPIGFPSDLYEWLRELGFRRHQPMAELVREAVRQYRERSDPQLGLPLGPR